MWKRFANVKSFAGSYTALVIRTNEMSKKIKIDGVSQVFSEFFQTFSLELNGKIKNQT